MQIGDFGRLGNFRDDLAHFRHDGRVHFRVKQHAARIAKQSVSPDCHQRCADDAHHRVKPTEVPEFPTDQRDDGQCGGRGIGNHVQVGRALVEIVMVSRVCVSRVMIMLVVSVMVMMGVP